MKNNNLQICDAVIHPGESLSLALPLPELFSCAPLYMPLKIIHGKRPGPCVLVIAAIHGNEINGTEIINRLLQVKVLQKLKGTLIMVPVVNVQGLINRNRQLPNGVDLNSSFPGSKNGTYAARMANLFIKQIFDKADYCIDLQTGQMNYTNLPQIFINYQNDTAKNLAACFNTPVISEVTLSSGSLAKYAASKNKPYLLYEAGEALRFDERAIKTGVKGILNVLKKLDMLSHKDDSKIKSFKSMFTEKNIWVRASSSGISYSTYKLGQYVEKGEALCSIKDPFGASAPTTIEAPENGVIVGTNNLPLVREGEALFQLAVFQHKMEQAANKLEQWNEKSETKNHDSKANSSQ